MFDHMTYRQNNADSDQRQNQNLHHTNPKSSPRARIKSAATHATTH